jgi:hypothetical protein
MDARPALRLLDFSNRSMGMNLRDVTHQQSLAAPPGGGNGINWVLGHVIVHRDRMLGLLGQPPHWDEATGAAYDRGSAPLPADGRGDGVLPLDALKDALEETYHRLREAVSAADEAVFAEPSGKGTVGDALIFMLGHEWYHAGQLGLLRRIAGLPGGLG